MLIILWFLKLLLISANLVSLFIRWFPYFYYRPQSFVFLLLIFTRPVFFCVSFFTTIIIDLTNITVSYGYFSSSILSSLIIRCVFSSGHQTIYSPTLYFLYPSINNSILSPQSLHCIHPNFTSLTITNTLQMNVQLEWVLVCYS